MKKKKKREGKKEKHIHLTGPAHRTKSLTGATYRIFEGAEPANVCSKKKNENAEAANVLQRTSALLQHQHIPIRQQSAGRHGRRRTAAKCRRKGLQC
jgi:hypothetical protein